MEKTKRFHVQDKRTHKKYGAMVGPLKSDIVNVWNDEFKKIIWLALEIHEAMAKYSILKKAWNSMQYSDSLHGGRIEHEKKELFTNDFSS